MSRRSGRQTTTTGTGTTAPETAVAAKAAPDPELLASIKARLEDLEAQYERLTRCHRYTLQEVEKGNIYSATHMYIGDVPQRVAALLVSHFELMAMLDKAWRQ